MKRQGSQQPMLFLVANKDINHSQITRKRYQKYPKIWTVICFSDSFHLEFCCSLPTFQAWKNAIPEDIIQVAADTDLEVNESWLLGEKFQPDSRPWFLQDPNGRKKDSQSRKQSITSKNQQRLKTGYVYKECLLPCLFSRRFGGMIELKQQFSSIGLRSARWLLSGADMQGRGVYKSPQIPSDEEGVWSYKVGPYHRYM